MVGQTSYVPPPYIPFSQSESEMEIVPPKDEIPAQQHKNDCPVQWSSGICDCFDDMPSCCIGLVCPCFLFGKNAKFLGSGTLFGIMHDAFYFVGAGQYTLNLQPHVEISSRIFVSIYVLFVKSTEKSMKGLEARTRLT